MSTLTISGTMTFPLFNGGPNTSAVVGAPVVNPSSTSGPTLDYDEGGAKTLSVSAGGSVSLSFDSVADGDFLYIGCDKSVSLVFNGGADSFTLSDGGFCMFYLGSMTQVDITGGAVDSEVSAIILGD
jgi:hypothetical protein